MGLARDSHGNFWVANNGAGTVTELSQTGAVLGTFTVGLKPTHIAFDPQGNVWVVNNGANSVTELAP